MVGEHRVGGGHRRPTDVQGDGMLARIRTALTIIIAGLTALLAPLAAHAAPALATVSPSQTPAPADEPFVNWTWLGLGLGGMIVMLVIMVFLTRIFAARQRRS
jgi:uncharacterized membrane protein